MIQTLSQDIRFALRQYRKRPGFTLLAVVILGVGLGANTAIFSVVNAFLIRPLPFKDPGRLTALFERNVVGTEAYNEVSAGNFLDWQRLSASFEEMSASTTGPVNLSSASSAFEPQRVEECACSGNLSLTLGVFPFLGRAFRPGEDRYGAPHVVIISYGLWQQRFGGARNAIGKQIRIDAENYEIIGIMPRSFAFPDRTVDLWIPLLTYVPPERQRRHDNHFLNVVGRLRPGVSVGQARAEIDGIEARYYRAHPDDVTGKGGNVVPLHDSLVRDVRTSLLLLLGAVGCVLLIACVNVANLLLTRAAGRSREISIRAAIGASRKRIISQLLTESLLLALFGGVIGHLARSLDCPNPGCTCARRGCDSPGWRYSVRSGSVPFRVWRLSRNWHCGWPFSCHSLLAHRPDEWVEREQPFFDAEPVSWAFRNALVTAEVALSLVLLVAAGLLMRSFSHLYQVQPGVRINHTLTMAVSLPDASYKIPAQRAAFLRQLAEHIQTVPGVLSSGLVTCAPVAGHCDDRVFSIEGHPLPAGQLIDALDRAADPGYFKAAGIPLLSGRTFTKQDGIGFDEKHPKIGSAVISESMAKQYFPHEDPIGKRIFFETDVNKNKFSGNPVPRYEVIGVVGDVLSSIDGKITPTVYVPLFDGAWDQIYVLLHTAVEPHSIIAAARNEINRLNPDLAIFKIQTMEEIIGHSASDRQFSLLLFGSFAGLAVLLAAVGLYGVLSYAVSQRKGEIGIRMALGASQSDVSGLVLMEGMKPALAGIGVGMVGALFASRILQGMLFGTTPLDPLTFVTVPPVLLAVAALACYLPAARASRIDPTVALRTE